MIFWGRVGEEEKSYAKRAVRGRRVCGEQAGKRKGLKREKDDFHFNVFFLEAK
jgi:hypothetical protein